MFALCYFEIKLFKMYKEIQILLRTSTTSALAPKAL